MFSASSSPSSHNNLNVSQEISSVFLPFVMLCRYYQGSKPESRKTGVSESVGPVVILLIGDATLFTKGIRVIVPSFSPHWFVGFWNTRQSKLTELFEGFFLRHIQTIPEASLGSNKKLSDRLFLQICDCFLGSNPFQGSDNEFPKCLYDFFDAVCPFFMVAKISVSENFYTKL